MSAATINNGSMDLFFVGGEQIVIRGTPAIFAGITAVSYTHLRAHET